MKAKKNAVVTSLSPEAFRTRYYVFFPDEKEYILLTPEQGEVIKDFDRNEKKHRERELRHGIPFDINDGDFDEHHPELICDDPADELLERYIVRCMWKQINELPEAQKRRLIKHYCYGVSIRQIAVEENVNFKSVKTSIELAIKSLQKYFTNEKL